MPRLRPAGSPAPVPAPSKRAPLSFFDLPSRNVALLCPGPSLPEVWNDAMGAYDVVIAINSAAWKYACDWLCAVDVHVFKHLWELPRERWPRVGVVTNASRGREAARRGLEVRPPPLQGKAFLEDPTVKRPADSRQCAYTMPGAVYFAREMAGAKGAIDIYGCDFSGAREDFAGVRGDHSKHRWRREASWLRVVWDPRIRVVGRMPAPVLAYISGMSEKMPI